MPNAKVLSEKQAIVNEIAKRINEANSGVLVDYKGISVAQDTALRAELRKNEIDYSVVKNTLTRLALGQTEMGELDSALAGTTSLATSCGDPIAPIRILSDYAKKLNEKFVIKAAFMEGKVLSMDELTEIAKLPSKNALISRVLGTMLAPISSLAVVLGQIVEKQGGSLETAEAAEETTEAAAETAEAPAAE